MTFKGHLSIRLGIWCHYPTGQACWQRHFGSLMFLHTNKAVKFVLAVKKTLPPPDCLGIVSAPVYGDHIQSNLCPKVTYL